LNRSSKRVGGFSTSGAIATRPMDPRSTRKAKKAPTKQPLPRGVIIVDKHACTGCRRCELICSAFKDGKLTRELARIEVAGTDVGKGPNFTPVTCAQCVDPPCLKACPTGAIVVDLKHGTYARIVDEGKCDGCGGQTSIKCVEACAQYFSPSRIRIDPERLVAIKCDLCDGDPQCVESCLFGALTYHKNEKGIMTGVGGES